MYRTFNAMWEGWSKGLAILFRRPVLLATRRAFEFGAITLGLGAGVGLMALHHYPGGALLFAMGVLFYLVFVFRIQRAHFPWKANLMSLWGLPIYVSLLLRSHLHFNRRGELTWKGRKYSQSAPKAASGSSIRKGDL
jgi:hypothetical protein